MHPAKNTIETDKIFITNLTNRQSKKLCYDLERQIGLERTDFSHQSPFEAHDNSMNSLIKTMHFCLPSTAHHKCYSSFLIKKWKLRNRVLDSFNSHDQSQINWLRYNAFKTSEGSLDLWLGILLRCKINLQQNFPRGLIKQRSFAELISLHIASL